MPEPMAEPAASSFEPRGGIETPIAVPMAMPVGAKETALPDQAEMAPLIPTASSDKEMLARLISVNRDGSDGQEHRITEESWDLGQTVGHICFVDDPYLGPRHCRLYKEGGAWLVRDLNSCNGVYLRLREPVMIGGGDYMLLGKEVLRFDLAGDHERSMIPAVQQGVLIFGSPHRNPWGRLQQYTVAGVFSDCFHLHQPQVVIGREEGDLLFTDDQFMSRRHLQITLDGDQAWVEDLGSSNGTFLRIREPKVLIDGDLIRIGDQLLRFEIAARP